MEFINQLVMASYFMPILHLPECLATLPALNVQALA